MENDHDEIVNAGSLSYQTARGSYQNPYPLGTPEHNAFERGWVQALKRDPNPVIVESSMRFDAPWGYEERSPRRVEPDSKARADRYRELKGKGR